MNARRVKKSGHAFRWKILPFMFECIKSNAKICLRTKRFESEELWGVSTNSRVVTYRIC